MGNYEVDVRGIFIDEEILSGGELSHITRSMISDAIIDNGDKMAGAINLVLIGRSGAGKSSLANYLYGAELFKTGDGSPVTEFGKKWESATIAESKEGFKINIYDSPGLEPDNYSAWKNNFDENMEDRYEPSAWIHGAFYVINAASGRVEPTELDVIKKFPTEYALPVSVALTNCDSVTKEQIASIKNVLKTSQPNLRINEVCSIKRKKRSGKEVERFGRETLLEDHAHKVAFFFVNRVGINLFSKDAPNCVNDVFDKIVLEMESSDFGLLKIIKEGPDALENFLGDITHDIDEYMDDKVEYLERATEDAREYLEQISDEVFYLPHPMEVMNEIDIDSEIKHIVPLLADIMDSFESGSTWDKFTGIFKAGYALLTIKRQFIDGVNNMRNMILEKLAEKERKCKQRLANPDKYINEDLTFFEW